MPLGRVMTRTTGSSGTGEPVSRIISVGAFPVLFEESSDVKFLDFSKKMVGKGATILGGCCESKPSHINKISTLKN